MRPRNALRVEHVPGAALNQLDIYDEWPTASARNRESHRSRQYSIR
jgi:hypothetical protein